ncbi:DUF2490 domain-containing protein [Sphingomonas quercus]|uniref:DUF2490 domain-containing protein n=1 Tax=Sphingomonas quercus TaxID=2842451 RepID=A0ABS6BEL9_9SPHN|nr:DUF2490 domain-containing protein [Sphingomonas quercus]MBU3076753.1 DUF2490 domain-containing protein [Sphingomonas quercus]
MALAPSVPAQAEDDGQLWIGGNAVMALGRRWRFSNEAIVRFSENRHGLYEAEMNSLLGYRVSGKVTLWAGYTHDPNYDAGHFSVMEHRGRQQVTFDNVVKIGRGQLSARLRMEERWREGASGTALRVRPFVRYALPFRAGGATALVLTHESFIDLNRTSFQRVEGEERMRNLIAVAAPLARNVNLEIGYLHQHGFRPGTDDSNDHAASISLSSVF